MTSTATSNENSTRYCTTRDASADYSFEEVLINGVPSGTKNGLFVPKQIPKLTKDQLDTWRTLSFPTLVVEIASLFIDPVECPRANLEQIIQSTFKTYFPPEVIPITRLKNSSIAIVELFHGPSLAFKDIAMFVTARLLEYFLTKRNKTATVVVATSGDTGPSCLMALEGLQQVRNIVVFPSKRVSPQQAMQMTNRPFQIGTRVVEVENATSDSLDVELFKLFADLEIKSKAGLCTLNSVNWCRVLFQIPHFFYAYFNQPSHQAKKTAIAVPTGAMGNAVAGVIAMWMGLPIDKLLIAQTQNDCVVEFLDSSIIQFNGKVVVPTIAPAIDIQSPYNIERLLWVLTSFSDNKNTTNGFSRIKEWMTRIERGEPVHVSLKDFEADWVKSKLIGTRHSESEILQIMRKVKDEEGIVLDPHTAVGLCGYNSLVNNSDRRDIFVLCMATAHPCKFPSVYENKLVWKCDDNLFETPPQMKMLENIPPSSILVDQNELGQTLRTIIQDWIGKI